MLYAVIVQQNRRSAPNLVRGDGVQSIERSEPKGRRGQEYPMPGRVA